MQTIQCAICKHYGLNKINIKDWKQKTFDVCKAFPQGIPDKIYLGIISHDKPIQGDNGYRFEPENLS